MGKQTAPPGAFSGQPWTPQNVHQGGNPLLFGAGGYDGPGIDFGQAAKAQGESGQQAVNRQTQANRPNQSTPFANLGWVQDPTTGAWTQHTEFAGPLGGAASSLEGQAAKAYGSPLDFGGLPQVNSGDAARTATEDALYGRQTSRLDPQFNQREQSMRTQLANQGLDPSSEAFRTEMDTFNRGRNDAYAGARQDAIAGGGAEQQRQFGMSMQDRSRALSEMLMGREQPMQDMKSMQGLLGMPDFKGAGQAQATPWLQALQAYANYGLGKTGQDNQANADMWKGIFGAAQGGAAFI